MLVNIQNKLHRKAVESSIISNYNTIKDPFFQRISLVKLGLKSYKI